MLCDSEESTTRSNAKVLSLLNLWGKYIVWYVSYPLTKLMISVLKTHFKREKICLQIRWITKFKITTKKDKGKRETDSHDFELGFINVNGK